MNKVWIHILTYCIIRLLFFICASLFLFMLIRSLPGTPMEILLASYQLPNTQENIQLLQQRWGLDQPLWNQYLMWLIHFLSGDWGNSLITALPVRQELMIRFPYSACIGMGGLLLGMLAAFPIGCMAAVKGRQWDALSRLLSLTAQTIPSFIAVIILVYWLGIRFEFFSFFSSNITANLILGVFLVSFYAVGRLSRVIKKQISEILNQPYVINDRLRGFSLHHILFFHIWKPVLYGLLAAAESDFSWIIGGTAVLEFALAVPGISVFCIESINRRDYAVIQAFLALLILWMFIVHALFDVILSYLDKKNDF